MCVVLIDASSDYLMVFEFADGGTLREHLEEHYHALTWEDKITLGLSIASGLKYLHELEIIHKDLVLYIIIWHIVFTDNE